MSEALSLSLTGNRTLLVSHLSSPVPTSLHFPFATLLPAYSEAERAAALAIVTKLVDLGSVEFCCVGPEAGRLHDSIDSAVEDRGDFRVATTEHSDYLEACEYFLLAAAGRPPMLLALVSDHPRIVAELKQLGGGH